MRTSPPPEIYTHLIDQDLDEYYSQAIEEE